MDYTSSDAYVVDAGTGHRMHQDTAPITTAVSAKDLNQVIWSLMKVLADASVSAASFDPTNINTYNRISLAIKALVTAAFTGSNQSLASPGFQKLPGGWIFQCVNVPIISGVHTSDQTFTYPIAFPTAIVHASGSADAGASGSWQPITVAVTSATLSGAHVLADTANAAENFASGRNARIFLLGY